MLEFKTIFALKHFSLHVYPYIVLGCLGIIYTK